jgi:hypothetical protein
MSTGIFGSNWEQLVAEFFLPFFVHFFAKMFQERF